MQIAEASALTRAEIETGRIFAPKFDANGLIPAIAQDAESGEVLMMAFMNREAIERTLATGEAHYYSRSRKELWHKGATSGQVQKVAEMRTDRRVEADGLSTPDIPKAG